jgi:hypothetical protein
MKSQESQESMFSKKAINSYVHKKVAKMCHVWPSPAIAYPVAVSFCTNILVSVVSKISSSTLRHLCSTSRSESVSSIRFDPLQLISRRI